MDPPRSRALACAAFGQQLVSRRDQVFGLYRLAEAGERHHAKQWRLDPVHEHPAGEPGEPGGDVNAERLPEDKPCSV